MSSTQTVGQRAAATQIATRPAAGQPAPQEAATAEPQDKVVKDTEDPGQRQKRYAGAIIPGVGAVITAFYGAKEIKQGHVKDGLVDLVRGICGVGSLGKAPVLLSPFIHVLSSGPLQLAGAIGGSASLLAAPLDGGRDLYNGIQGLRSHELTPKEEAKGLTLDAKHRQARETALIGAAKLGLSCLSAAGAILVMPPLGYAAIGLGLGLLAYQNRKGPIVQKILSVFGQSDAQKAAKAAGADKPAEVAAPPEATKLDQPALEAAPSEEATRAGSTG